MLPKINRDLVPVKCHFFFFFAALGPLLPQLNVFGRQLGVSPEAMGLVTAVLPLLWALAKPAFGYLVDYFPTQRKLTFMLLICAMTGSYCGLWALPAPAVKVTEQVDTLIFQLNDTVYVENLKTLEKSEQDLLQSYKCHWNDSKIEFPLHISHAQFVNTVFVEEEVTQSSCSLLQMGLSEVREGQIVCEPKRDCFLICLHEDLGGLYQDHDGKGELEIAILNSSSVNRTENDSKSVLSSTKVTESSAKANDIQASTKVPSTEVVVEKSAKNDVNVELSSESNETKTKENIGLREEKLKYRLNKGIPESTVAETSDKDGNFYTSSVFWWFVVLMCLGTVAFNVANCIGDAVCFDVLGPERASKYGSQRAWGTAGYGLTALAGGWLVDYVSTGHYKRFYPAFLLAIGFTVCDLVCCRGLKLPQLSSPTDSGKALRDVLRMPKVLVFIVFAVIAGTFDSFIIYYMFWFLEELSESTGHSAQIKLIEGVVVAGQSFVGELLFFHYSGAIIRRFGYGSTMSVSLLCYGVRMMMISFITNPWHLVFIESVMQGPTYALCYASIVGYAAAVAPEGYSATVQGIVAGMDDGLGFAIGSLAGGLLYSTAGGRGSFRVMSVAAVAAAAAHVLLRRLVLELGAVAPEPTPEEGEKMLQVTQALSDNAIYRDTVLPLTAVDVVRVSGDR